MTPEGDALSNTSRAMMTALNKSDPDEQDIEAINRGADLLSGLVRDNKIAGGFSDLLEGMPMPEPEPEMG